MLVTMKRLTIALTVAVIALVIAVLYLIHKSNQLERAMKLSIHPIAAWVR
jgi:hypothetical protein